MPKIKNNGTLYQNSFSHGDITSVYGGENLRCFLTGEYSAERSHILGRREDCCASILNLGAVCRDFHAWGVRDHADMRRVLLRLAYEKVMQAVALHRYVFKPVDYEFMKYGNEFLKKNNLDSLYIV
jgi:hypothetical protein